MTIFIRHLVVLQPNLSTKHQDVNPGSAVTVGRQLSLPHL